MFIRHTDGYGITNIDNVNRICLNGRYITAYMVDGSNHHIAGYDTAEEAAEHFNDFFDFLVNLRKAVR